MDISYFKDSLFDLLNESTDLNIADIQSNDKENIFLASMQDGSSLLIQVSTAEKNK